MSTETTIEIQLSTLCVLVSVLVSKISVVVTENYASAVGDPGIQREGLRVAFEAWNFCNEVGEEAPHMGNPRAADCFNLSSSSSLNHKVTEVDNRLGAGKPFRGVGGDINNPDLYAVKKELYLGSICEVADTQRPWHFWMIMLKNGNYDTESGLCPENGKKVAPSRPGRFPCLGKGCMNQPITCHQQTQLQHGIMRGGFNGTSDLNFSCGGGHSGLSYYEAVWEKKVNVGSWVFKHKLQTSENIHG